MSLINTCKQRIIDQMIFPLNKQDDYMIMIVDDDTLRILSSCCKVYDLLAKGISLVELIQRKRQPLPEIEAIYFLSPKKSSIEFFIKEFTHPNKKQYKCAHLYFSSPIPTDGDLMNLIAKSKTILPFIKSFFDFNMNFIAYEQRVFHLDQPESLLNFYPICSDAHIQTMSDKLLTLLCSLNEKPSIRYQDTQTHLARKLAMQVNSKLKSHALKDKMKKNSQLIICERSIDLCTLFLHEYTYQAFAYDLLNINCCSKDTATNPNDTYKFRISNSDNIEEKEVLIGENDDMWLDNRHDHIQKVNNRISEEAKIFTKENPTALLSKNADLSVEQTSQAIRNLPKFEEMISKFWTHISMCEESLKYYKEYKLSDVGVIEQDIACSIDKDGKDISSSKIYSSLLTMLKDDDLNSDLKARLILLFMTQYPGANESDRRRKIFEASGLSLQLQRTILQFLDMELHVENEYNSRLQHILSDNAERLKYFKTRAKNCEYDTTRYEPYLKEIMKKAVQGSLSNSSFPYLETPSESVIKSNDFQWNGFNNSSVQWEWGSSKDNQSQEKKQLQDGNEKKLIIFVIGDLSFSEMRCAYEISKAMKADIYIGGTTISSPRQFLSYLRSKN